MSWRVRATEVRPWNGGLRWSLEAWRGDLSTTVTADTHRNGTVYDLQSGPYVGWTGDEELDREVCLHIGNLVAHRKVLRQLDAIERPRSRSDRLRWAA